MAGSFSNYAEEKFLELIVGKNAFSKPTVYVALSTADPTDDGSGLAEPSGNGYARVETSGDDWNESVNGSISNAENIVFPEPTGPWETITHFALFDAPENGNMLAHGTVETPRSVTAGYVPKYNGGSPGALVINLS